MKNLEFRNIFFAPGERGKGIIKETKGSQLRVSRKDLKEFIKSNPEIGLVIPAQDVEKEIGRE